ncbi:MAG TPA: H-NS histone family protein [Burkholderiaceae bacterium]|jgi:DNA-binding protein H-NS|nr:H-NS histone family protein [Burkholderiaceae bacterium]
MANLQDLLSQKAEIERQISDARRTERNDAVAKVRALMTEHGLSASDLVAKAPGPRASMSGRKVAAKYRDPVTGQTWTGRGLKPKWLSAALEAGKQLNDFAV